MNLITPGEIVAGSSGLAAGNLYFWSYAGMAAAALGISAVILAFIYVWGSLFRNAQLHAYVKSELYELVVTAIMIPMIYGAVAAMGSLTLGSFVPAELIPVDNTPLTSVGTTENTLIYDATAQYYQRVENDMSGWLEMNYIINMYVDQVASVTPYARPLGIGLVASPLAGFASPLKQLLYQMTVALALAFVINHAQLVVYVFSLQAFLKYYLPLGIFLRAFVPTRRLGGTIIGVALAFLFVFPAVSVITYTMFYSPLGGPLVTFRMMLTQYMGEGCDPQSQPNQVCFAGHFKNFYQSNFTGVGGSMVDLVGGVFGGLGSLLQSVVGNMFLMLMMFPIGVVSWAFAIGFIVPAFNVIIFTQAAKSLSKSFGEEVDIGSLTRMI
ncbi:hypothetical protein L0Y65_06465 [Candidatus Micrarchaeota archaeon]|nr:hypothetical protein [Candidatus Micrarchaeota archaeon]